MEFSAIYGFRLSHLRKKTCFAASWRGRLRTRFALRTIGSVFLALACAVQPAQSESRRSVTAKNEKTARTQSSTKKNKSGKLRAKTVKRGSSAKSVRKEAGVELPLSSLSKESRRKAQEIIESASLFRRLPTVSFPSNHETYRFFTTYPEVAVSIWRVMKISKCEMWQTGPATYEMDARDGSVGVVEVLYRSKNENIIICDGKYTSPLLVKPIKARCLVSLKTDFGKDANGQPTVTHYADMYVSFPSNAVEAAAKLISPVSYLLADRNFVEISMFLELMSAAMQNQPGWMERVADRIDGVIPGRKQQLLKTTARVYVEARKRVTSGKSQNRVSVDEVLRPLREAAKKPQDELLPIEFNKVVKSADAKGGKPDAQRK